MKLFDKDARLGLAVRDILITHKIENPITQKIDHAAVTKSIADLIQALGLSAKDESMAKTPLRVSNFLINELFYGLDYHNFPHISFDENTYNYDTPIISKQITFHSTCEHHLVSIIGHATVAYIPTDRIVGLSKINRIVDFFAKRPQVQERVTLQIFHALKHILNTADVAVVINAEHHCITMRGTNDPDVKNLTYQASGKFLTKDLLGKLIDMS